LARWLGTHQGRELCRSAQSQTSTDAKVEKLG
jgi:hypothetical protein